MRVVMLTKWPEVGTMGGVATHLRGLVPRLAEQPDVDLHIVSFGNPGDVPPGCVLHCMPTMRIHSAFPPSAIRQLVQALHGIKPDVVHLQGLGMGPYIFAYSRVKQSARVATVHAFGSTEGRVEGRSAATSAVIRRIAKPVERGTLEKSDHIIAVSQDVRRRISDFGLESKVSVIGNGFEPSAYAGLPPGRLDGEPAILFAGRLSHIKGPDLLLEAFTTIKTSLPGAVLHIVGGGPEEGRLIAQSRMLGIAEAVVFHGRVDGELMPTYFAGCDITVLPSRQDSFPLTMIEAMAAGRVVVATAVGGMAELIGAGKDLGILVEPENPQAIARGVIAAAEDLQQQRNMGMNARRLVYERYSWDAIAQATAEVYRAAVAAKRQFG